MSDPVVILLEREGFIVKGFLNMLNLFNLRKGMYFYQRGARQISRAPFFVRIYEPTDAAMSAGSAGAPLMVIDLIRVSALVIAAWGSGA